MSESCAIAIHTFEMTPEVDSSGFYVLKNHVIAHFQLTGITNLELQGFNPQNVIFGLSLSRTAHGNLRLELDPCYGLAGFIEARSMTIRLHPAGP
jgi:hypothetical protein